MDKELQRSVEKIRHPRYIRKRDGRLEEFDQRRITIAISKAFNAVGEKDGEIHKRLSDEVVRQLYERYGEEGVPTVEEIQDLVEHTLMKNGFYEVSRAYILYREKRKELRELAFLLESGDMVDKYLQEMSWYVRENANLGYSMQGLNNYLVSKVISQYWLMRIYPPEIRRAHINGDFHIHNLGILGPYCVGWSLPDLLMEGFGGVANKLESKPPKHFSVALGQVVNFMYTLQGEAAGAQAFSNFDTYLAPYIREDRLTYREVLQTMQEFLFNMNVPTRVGGQTPFTNITMDLRVPRFMENEGVIIGGKIQDSVFGDFQEEMEMFNKAYLEVMLQGDAKGRIFSFPIPTYNVTEDFPWDYEPLWKLTAKFGAPYFSNFINSDMKPEDVRSMCCRLRIDNRELRKRGGSFFGANPLTGSIGVVTINMPRLGYLSKEEDEFFERLDHLMDLAMQSLEIKRKTVERFTEYGLYPFSRHYLRHIKEGFGSYWKNHFSTIGLLGMNEACLNFFGEGIESDAGLAFARKVLLHMRERLADYQIETGNIYNLEATPAEGSSYRLAKLDKSRYPDIIVANERFLASGAEPFYTNSTWLPVDHELSLGEALRHQDQLQPLYTGGTVFHIYLGEAYTSWEGASKLIRRTFKNFHLPYVTITPTFSVCPTHGYISGEHFRCPTCGAACEVYSRIVGYFRPVSQWNKGKQSEFKIRKIFGGVKGDKDMGPASPLPVIPRTREEVKIERRVSEEDGAGGDLL